MMVEFPEVGQNFPKLEETAPQACKKPQKIKITMRQTGQFFYLENLTKPLYFRLKQKSLNTPAFIFN